MKALVVARGLFGYGEHCMTPSCVELFIAVCSSLISRARKNDRCMIGTIVRGVQAGFGFRYGSSEAGLRLHELCTIDWLSQS